MEEKADEIKTNYQHSQHLSASPETMVMRAARLSHIHTPELVHRLRLIMAAGWGVEVCFDHTANPFGATVFIQLGSRVRTFRYHSGPVILQLWVREQAYLWTLVLIFGSQGSQLQKESIILWFVTSGSCVVSYQLGSVLASD